MYYPKDSVKVRIKGYNDNKFLYSFNFTGYGFVKQDDWNTKQTVVVSLEDDYCGARGWSFDKTELEKED